MAAVLWTPAAFAATVSNVNYCLTMVAPSQPGGRDLRVVSEICSDTPKTNTVLPTGVAIPAATQLLVIFHENIDFQGRFDTVAGQEGPCDAAGYGFSDLTLVNFNVGGISSYEYGAGSNCHVATYWNQTGFQGTARVNFIGNQPFVGATWNDDLFSMKIHS